MRVTPPVHRTPHGQSAGTRHSDPGKGLRPQFRCHRIPFDASSVVYFRSSLQSIHDVFISRLLTVTFITAAFRTEAAYGCLKPAPASRLRRAFLHLRHSTVFSEHVLGTTNPRPLNVAPAAMKSHRALSPAATAPVLMALVALPAQISG